MDNNMDNNHLERLIQTESRSKSNAKRLDEHEQKIEELEKTYSIMQKMDFRMGNMEKTVATINQKLDATSSEKGKKWDKLVDYVFYFVLAALLAYIAHELGIK